MTKKHITKKAIASLLLGTMLAVAPGAAFAETMTINLGSAAATMDGGQYVMDGVAGMTADGTIMVPVRTIAEAFGGVVAYDAHSNMVELIFTNGHWATIEINPPDTDETGDTNAIIDKGMFINNRLYIPAELMAVCLGGSVELIDYGQDEVYRVIYHVR